MNRIERRSSHPILITLSTVLFLTLLGGVKSAQAQWTTDTSGNTTTSDKIGIGTTTPNFKLDVNRGGTSDDVVLGIDANGSNTYSPMLYFRNTGTAISKIMSAKDLQFQNTDATSLLYLKTNGNFGIGTTSPDKRLHIAGNGNAVLKLENTQASGHSWWLYSGAFGQPGDFGIYDETAVAYRMYFTGSGNIGIGTTSPAAKLDIVGTFRSYSTFSTYTADGLYGSTALPSKINTPSGQSILFGYEDFSSGDYSPRIGLQQNYDAVGSPQITPTKASIGLIRNGSITIKGGANNTEFARIDSSGNVGIGRTPNDDQPTTPYKLDIAGDVRVSGNIAARFQDVAEWVPSTHVLSAGTVVILNPAKTNEVMASEKAYDTRVAGVVSERPGLALGEAGKDKALVATTGRVKVMVDATKSPIHVGDLLVTSDEEGVAMKSEPVDVGGVKLHRPGTLIGKALEPLESGKGKILVLLSLQ